MPFKIERNNSDKDEIIVMSPTFPSVELAIRAAMREAMDFSTAHWDMGVGSNQDGPADNTRFKIYVDRRVTPQEVNLRYDWVDATQPIAEQDRTNDIVWQIVQV